MQDENQPNAYNILLSGRIAVQGGTIADVRPALVV